MSRIFGFALFILFLLMLAMMAFAQTELGPVPTQPDTPPTLNEWFRAEVKQHDGVIYFRIPIGNLRWCFTRSTDEIVSIPDQWQNMTGMALKTIPLTLKEIQVCTDTLPPTIWVVARNPSATDNPPTRPLKNEQMINVWRILVGIPCEPDTINVIKSGGNEYHHAINSDGQRGITVCEKSQ